MKRILLVALLAAGVAGLGAGRASAGSLFHHCHDCCGFKICAKQPNAFSPPCIYELMGKHGHCGFPIPMMPWCGPQCCPGPDCCGDGSCAADGSCGDGSCLGQLPDTTGKPTEVAPTPTPGFQAPMPMPVPQQTPPSSMMPRQPMPEGPAQMMNPAAYRYPYGYAYPPMMPVSYNPAAYGYGGYP